MTLKRVLIVIHCFLCVFFLNACSTRKQLAPVVNLKSSGSRNYAPSMISMKKTQNVVNLKGTMWSSQISQTSVNNSGNKTAFRNRNNRNGGPLVQNRVPQQNVQKNVQRTPQQRSTQNAGYDTSTRFIWPYKGPILRNFNQAHLKGIDIKGQLGMPVKAASGGVVVYSGNGLKGYGNLIIIKHNENFLTAYAHNEKLMVKEGERVSLGQEIAKVGKTGTDSVKLHFEIRYKGKPIDPLRLLPKG